ncbi:hypothetical protein EAH89_11580 [Roseomonas nepalensis]|uniref:Peptidase M48 domain-containing protein n=1 Tax=Muricoccus nepalensis TaxID=1854500 RepID=A0A502G664_9PROT|nr:M48 family metalloprotease [Roseomonas nepalensis]TPG57102.1 hypothetical protein EAH89_11580 [Roseomonas nepalensis]
MPQPGAVRSGAERRRKAWTSRYLLAAVALAGCGTQHALPSVTAEEVRNAAQTIAAAPVLTASPRDPVQDGPMLERVTARLAPPAEPFCDAYLGRACAFQVVLDASPSGAATMSAEASGAGRITVSTGMLRAMATDDETAAVVAHEMGHHLAGHLARGLARGSAAGIAAGSIVGAVIPFGGLAAWAIGQGAAELGAGAARLAFSKEEEREADYLAVYLLARAGYDPAPAASLWVRLARRDRLSGEAGVLDRHPSDPERLAAWRRTVQEVRASPDLVPRLSVTR